VKVDWVAAPPRATAIPLQLAAQLPVIVPVIEYVVGTATVQLKFCPVTLAPLTVNELVGGVNVAFVKLGVNVMLALSFTTKL
jgi:hypothetical protein